MDYHETFSLVVKANTVQTILALVVSNKWWLQQVDINNAFLNRDLIEEIYMKKSPRFEVVDEKVIQGRFLFIFYKTPSSNNVFLLVYVDDIILTRDSNTNIKAIIQSLHNQFSLKDLGDLSYFLGLEVTQHGGNVHISQHKYARYLLGKVTMGQAKPVVTSLVSSPTLSSLVGSPLQDGTRYR
ncbi:Retrovirus-related Pol polyprotein from transposon TNT 1-94 [Gossypium australe]|uniref:Retrovirus-related Pol polyprotein from transposon TNT 1-94 n=1 Tax=Gossypium australe TaxID=47621 RepID=A0A5B6WYD0_9ROSI|nr:Retrovirus-related Pol polyprotein from transposon TNT 1-94 [Gossypium australe]